jgi:hypothetical protein
MAKKTICSTCDYTLQEDQNNLEIDKYTLCSKCAEKWKVIIKHFTNSD